MKKILVLGAGMIGRAIVKDMAKYYEVNVIDINKDNLSKLKNQERVKVIKSDATDLKSLKKYSSDCNLIISAVPGFLGFEVLKKIIKCKKNVVDLSFFGEDAFELDELAQRNKITVVVDCGVAPGLSNIILGYHNSKMKIDSFECMVGGLPVKREWPYQYKAPFSPIDVIEEYTRPSRIVKDGKIIVKEALSDVETITVEPVGELEAFNTDGLRSLLKTMKIQNMTEKTLRYPGHTELMKILRETGFFSNRKLLINGNKISPIEITSKLLFPIWRLEDEEKEFTILKINIAGTENGKRTKYRYDIFDKYDDNTKTTSMARTTGYTCTAAARLVLEGKFSRIGICPPEFIGAESGCFDVVFTELQKRGIHPIKKCTVIN
jgi:saccharopine dehydrogenase-like NADP-dependent oxidoreductase